jgi:sugar phosphate isomerase/epimerase
LLSIEQARAELGSLEAVAACLARHGMRIGVLELLHVWALADDARTTEELAVMQAAVEVFQPDVVLAATLAPAIEPGGLEHLKRQCRALAPRKVALEFLPFGGLPSLAAALAALERVDEENLGLVLDTWHFARAGLDYALLAQVPGDRIHFVQLNDAAVEPAADLLQETMTARLRPGEGIVDWPRMIGILDGKALTCPVGSEQYSDAVKRMDLDSACRYLFASVQDILADPARKPG